MLTELEPYLLSLYLLLQVDLRKILIAQKFLSLIQRSVPVADELIKGLHNEILSHLNFPFFDLYHEINFGSAIYGGLQSLGDLER